MTILSFLPPHLERVATAPLPTQWGEFVCHVYRGRTGVEHVAMVVGTVDDAAPVLVRLHSECLTGDVFGSRKCDCGEQLRESLRLLQAEGRGILLYLRQEGRGIGLTSKIQAYALQSQGYDTVEANLALGLPADARDYGEAAGMLRDLGVSRVRLLTNNGAKVDGLQTSRIEVTERVPLQIPSHATNHRYLWTKQEKMGHIFVPALQPDKSDGPNDPDTVPGMVSDSAS